jgi:hypothetical protein
VEHHAVTLREARAHALGRDFAKAATLRPRAAFERQANFDAFRLAFARWIWRPKQTIMVFYEISLFFPKRTKKHRAQ